MAFLYKQFGITVRKRCSTSLVDALPPVFMFNNVPTSLDFDAGNDSLMTTFCSRFPSLWVIYSTTYFTHWRILFLLGGLYLWMYTIVRRYRWKIRLYQFGYLASMAPTGHSFTHVFYSHQLPRLTLNIIFDTTFVIQIYRNYRLTPLCNAPNKCDHLEWFMDGFHHVDANFWNLFVFSNLCYLSSRVFYSQISQGWNIHT